MNHSVELIPPGQTVSSVLPGDFFLVHRDKLMSKLIQFGQRRRYTKEEAYWNHCGLFINPNGNIAEALTKTGITPGNISKYKDVTYYVVHINAVSLDRDQMMDFTRWAYKKPYGLLTDVSLAFWCLFGGKFDVSLDGTMICSGFVARALERAGHIFDRDPTHETPADLARHFNVHQTKGK